MRIHGKRASTYTNEEIAKMMSDGCDSSGKELSIPQMIELRKVLQFRKKEGK